MSHQFLNLGLRSIEICTDYWRPTCRKQNAAIDKSKCNQGRLRCNTYVTVATTATSMTTTQIGGNTYMLLHLAATKDAIATYLLPPCTNYYATQINGCNIAVQKQPTVIWSPYHLSIATHEMLMQLRIGVAVFPTNCNINP